MLNQVMLVGRLASEPEVKKLESGKEVTIITLVVNRSYKNAEGIYESDFINCVLWDGLASNLSEYCKKGDVVGIRGRLQNSIFENAEEKNKRNEVIVEKVTFLSSKSEEKEGE